MKVKTLALAAGILLHGIVLAGTTGKIAGDVRDAQTGEGLVGANVILEGTSMGAATDIDGHFVILNVPPGKYNVSASAVGYSRRTVTSASVSVDLTTSLDFRLQTSIVEKEEVVVTAERRVIKKDLTSSEARVDASQISKLAVREVSEVLTLQAGITADRFGGIHIRGGRTSEVGYWVDGISVSDVYDGGQAVQVDNNAIQELQVISGTFNAEYGQAMSGIVNIVTKDGGQNFRGSLSTYAGSYYTQDRSFYNLQKFRPFDTKNLEGSFSGPSGVPGLSFYMSGRYLKSNGWLYGQKLFNPDGSRVTGVDTIFNASQQMTGVTKVDNAVPMNGRERLSGQVKLTYQITGDLKFALTGVGSKIDYRDYNHDYVYNPDGDVNKYDRGYNVSGVITHALSARSFYTINFAFFKKSYQEHLYEDPFDSRYILDPFAFNRNLDEFYHMGTNLHQFKRTTQTREIKIDFTSQISNLHELKAGIEGKFHRLYFEDYYITPVQDTLRDSQGVLQNFYRATIPDHTGPNYQDYTQKPFEISFYAQDKLEYERMIVNFGVRVDFFNSRGKVLNDLQDPNVYVPQKAIHQSLTLGERLASWYHLATAKSSVSPRLGISYPITDRGVLHFSYGHFLQIPSFEYLYQRPGYKTNSVDPLQGVYGNPDLKPQRTIMYEFGLQQQLNDVLSFDVTGFYRDTRDWVSTSAPIPIRDSTGQTATSYYTMFVNKDYANTRGITLTVNKRMADYWTLSFSYTFQVAEGVNSNPDEEQGALVSNNEPSKTLSPLDWDQTHTVNLSLGFGQDDWGAYLVGRYGSGLPYSPAVNQAEAKGEDAARISPKNSRRRPEQMSLDLRAFKNISVGPINMSVFLKVFNLLDRRNEADVYGQTGRATATPAQLGVGGLSSGINRYNTAEEFLVRPDFYTEPREIQFGIELNF